MEAGGVARLTILAWVKAGLLPEPESVPTGNRGGHANRYPAWAIERARFIGAKRRSGHTKAEVLELLRELDRAEKLNSSGAKRRR